MDIAALTHEFERRGIDPADIHSGEAMRVAYASDASLYRVKPQIIVQPRHRDEVLAALEVARETGTPITSRGSGTSIAGNAIGPGIVLDTARHLDRLVEFDDTQGTALVQPGIIHASLQQVTLPHGWRFGPDPSTHTRCTIGGMIGNNACGSRALGYGRTADNLEALTVALIDGTVLELGPGGSTIDELVNLGDENKGHIRPNFAQFTRQVSGYSLEHLLPERLRLDRFMAGTEGTLGVILDARMNLVREPNAVALAVLGYPSMADAGDDVPALLNHDLIACEGLDKRIVEPVRRKRGSVPDLPSGAGWLLVEVPGETVAAAEAAAHAVVRDAAALGSRIVSEPAEMKALWKIREDGAGLAAKSLSRPAHSGLEDAAVPPAKLGEWLRTFEELLSEFDLETAPYGHFGDGCVHARIDFTFDDDGARLRRFLEVAADAIQGLGGSISGEHGDGRQRSELLARTYDPTSITLFGQVKQICDPDNLLNPGVLVNPQPLDADVRPGLKLVGTGNSLLDEVHNCTGVGKCVTKPSQQVMCPSYAATRNEIDSTRGRARVLQDATAGLLPGGVRNPAVDEALDLCLACKGCASDCPTGVDMAAYKAEVLHEQYKRRPRPRSHYLLGRMPQALAKIERAPAALRSRLTSPETMAKWSAGVDPRRTLPAIAPRSFRKLTRKRDRPEHPDVWIWADTFTNHFLPEHGVAAVELLQKRGLTVGIIHKTTCCSLTLITTGQLDAARKQLRETVSELNGYATRAPVIGLEPSCLATLRDDAPRLLDTEEARHLASRTRTLAEFLHDIDYTPPDLSGVEIVAQPHCHHASILGWEKDEALLTGAGATVHRVGGCCGLAGNFGMEQGHYDVSVTVAETQLLPAVRAHPGAVVLADGLSCYHQLNDLEGVHALHLAELLNQS